MSLPMRIILLVAAIFIVLGGTAGYLAFAGPGTPALSNAAECASNGFDVLRMIEGPFRYINDTIAGGTAAIEGRIVLREDSAEEPAKAAYIEILPEQEKISASIFYSYFSNLAEQGNSVNMLEDDALLFRLGIFENGAVTSTAHISPLAEKKIRKAADGEDLLALSLEIPVFRGMGAPDDFSFACGVRVAE